MALFQKQPIRQELVLPYVLHTSISDRLLIVGLGNPGKKYEATRHNVGFMVIDALASNLQFPAFSENKDFKAAITEHTIGSKKIVLVKPTTYMNDSGISVQKISHFYKVPPEKMLIIHDELSIPFGTIRTRVGGQAAGHNGIKSIIQHCGDSFGRLRVGIKNKQTPSDDTSAFVLAPFTVQEKKFLNDVIKETELVATEYAYGGILPHDTRKILLA